MLITDGHRTEMHAFDRATTRQGGKRDMRWRGGLG